MDSDTEDNQSNLVKPNLYFVLLLFSSDDNKKSNYLTDVFISICASSLWCIKFFFISLWQVLLFTKEELHYTQYETINSLDVLSMNNSAGQNYSKKFYRELPRRRLPKSNSQYSR